MEEKLKQNVWWLSAASFFTDISSEMIFPILPIFLKTVLGASYISIGIIEGIAEGIGSFLKYFSGYMSDRWGKRKGLTLLGYGVSAFAKLSFALAQSSLTIALFRAVDRFGKGVRTSPRDALIAESVPNDERGKYFGLHRSADTAGAIIGTVIAIMLLYFLNDNISGTIRFILFISVIPAIFGFLLLFGVKEVSQITGKKVKHISQRALFDFGTLSLKFKRFLVIAGLFGFANYSYAFYILRADDIGIALFLIPVVYLIYNMCYALSAFPAGSLSDRFGRVALLVIAFGLFALVNIGFAYGAGTLSIWFLFGLYGLFIGLTDGVFKAFVTDLVAQERRGEGLGLYHMVVGLSVMAGNIVGGVLWYAYGVEIPFLLSASVIVCAGMMLVVYFRDHVGEPVHVNAHSFRGYRG